MGERRVLLFGSAAATPNKARDIDLAVEGIPLNRMLDADATVHDILRQPTDLVSKEENPAFFSLIARHGKVLYEQG